MDLGRTELARSLSDMVVDARTRTLETIADLDDEQMMGPRLRIVNPPLWEVGHVGWFQEYWNLRYLGEGRFGSSRLEGADELYNSSVVAHDARWNLALLSRQRTLSYMREVLEDVLEKLHVHGPSDEVAYFIRLATFHEDMHGEAFTYTRQTHGLPPPHIPVHAPSLLRGQPRGPLEGDVGVPGGEFMLGASPDIPFVFDNEKWEHPVHVAPFEIARGAVTNREFAAFVDAGGYRDRELWSEEGWGWRTDASAKHPVYWERHGGPEDEWRWWTFDEVAPLAPHAPVIHVNWYEADAYCRWAGRRLPTEAEWELAASAEPTADGRSIAPKKRLYPWGEEPPSSDHANLDARLRGCADVAAFPAGDSAFGCRQMIGNVWEHCLGDFEPYPGFEADPYEDYSQPWFGGGYKTMRGGAWPTRGRLLRNTWRNFAEPHRRDLFTGFRTCAR